jgi:outer membrane protein OmpA-like peptidoglycan-associated protein
MKSGPYKYARQALPLVFVFALASCSFFDDVVGIFDGDEPPTQTASDKDVRNRSEADRAAADDSDTPSLTSVPNRPETPVPTNRERVVEGLISDRENARYTDEAIRLQGSTRAPQATQSAARPATPPQPPIIPAPRATVPAVPAVTARPSVPPAPVVQPVIQPRPVAPTKQLAAASSPSVIVDISAIGGGGYVPASARVDRETQVATIQFNRSSANLNARDRQIIATVASAQRSDDTNVLIVGHASSRTQQLSTDRHEVANFRVSFKRANAVAQALIQSGVPSNRVTVEAVLDDQPVYSESMPNGEAGNRRTEIFFIR